jgi:hypothetical protein
MPTQDGRPLAQLISTYRDQRAVFLEWAEQRGYPEETALQNYRRALIAWYETRRPDATHTAEVLAYLTAAADHYFGGPAPPDLPRPVVLTEEGEALFTRYRRMEPSCRELLLLADYHQLSTETLVRVRESASEDALAIELRECRARLVALTPDRPDLYRAVLTVAGRQDLVGTLLRLEQKPAPASAPETRLPGDDIELEPIRPRRPFVLPSFGLVVAAVLFGLLLWLLYDTFGRPAPERLADRYFSPYPNIFATTPPATDYEYDLQRILRDYDRGDYRRAYDELLPAAGVYPASYLYLGVSALALDDPARALDWLGRVASDSPYASAAQWYIALARLDLGGDAGAKNILNEIAASSGHPYRTRAQQLLSDL